MRKKKQHISRKGIVFAAVVCLCMAQVQPIYAETARATTMRLESTEGDVSLENQNGTILSISEGMKLLNGNALETQAASYAYVSLDSKRVVKLDGLSEAEVRQNGKKLEILLHEGKLFFNVENPLQEDESLQIKTSTLVTGVRGTSGILLSGDEQSTILLLTGRLLVNTPSNDKPPVILEPGQSATIINNNPEEINKKPFTEGDVPGFTAAEIKKNPVLQKEIDAQSPLSSQLIIGDADEKTRQDELNQINQSNASAHSNAGTSNTIVNDQIFEPDADSNSSSANNQGGSGSTSGESGGSESETGAEEENPEEPTTELNSPSAAELNAALQASNNVTLTGTTTIATGETVTIGAGKTLNVASGSVANEGTISIQSNNSLHILGGTFTNASGGTIELGVSGAPGLLDVQNGNFVSANGSSIKMTAESSITIAAGAQATLPAGFSCDGNLTNHGEVKLYENTSCSGTLTNNGQLRLYNGITNTGTITNTETLTLYNADIGNGGIITNRGTLLIDNSGNGAIQNRPTASFTNTDTGKIEIQRLGGDNAAIFNLGIFQNDGEIACPPESQANFLSEKQLINNGMMKIHLLSVSGEFTNTGELCATNFIIQSGPTINQNGILVSGTDPGLNGMDDYLAKEEGPNEKHYYFGGSQSSQNKLLEIYERWGNRNSGLILNDTWNITDEEYAKISDVVINMNGHMIQATVPLTLHNTELGVESSTASCMIQTNKDVTISGKSHLYGSYTNSMIYFSSSTVAPVISVDADAELRQDNADGYVIGGEASQILLLWEGGYVLGAAADRVLDKTVEQHPEGNSYEIGADGTNWGLVPGEEPISQMSMDMPVLLMLEPIRQEAVTEEPSTEETEETQDLENEETKTTTETEGLEDEETGTNTETEGFHVLEPAAFEYEKNKEDEESNL